MEAIRGKYQPRRKATAQIHISSYLDEDLYEWFYLEAKRLNISKSHLLARALRLYQEAQRIYEERKTK